MVYHGKVYLKWMRTSGTPNDEGNLHISGDGSIAWYPDGTRVRYSKIAGEWILLTQKMAIIDFNRLNQFNPSPYNYMRHWLIVVANCVITIRKGFLTI